ncbi:hypothetical protein [Alkalicoccobacillus porphyridii]|uniref:hypothetical protein n=1 Tax=Alkalicoccobacillus porphyridii TaxID=2597270 RepID=UPI00163D7B4D|nr:hypothetical protein [Alkalicoccobacillus porphyridii]
MFDYIRRLCIALVLAVFIGALFLGAATANVGGMDITDAKETESKDIKYLFVLN